MSEMPHGWTTTRLGDLGDVRLGKMLDKAKNKGLPAQYLRNINVRWFRFDLTDLQMLLVSEDERELLSVQDGDLFICEGGEPGHCAVWRNGTNSLVYQKALHRFRASGAIIPELLMYRLRHDAESSALQEAFTGTTIKHFTRESLSRYEIPLPPLNEQRRITDKLDAALARVDACRERLDHVLAILKRFRQAILAAATSGKLTEEWRGESQGRTPWIPVKLRELTELITKGASPKWQGFSYVDSDTLGTLFITSENVREMRLDVAEPKYVESAFNNAQRRSIVRQGDLLTNIVGASIGRTAI